MENYCKNCGAPIKDNAKFCQECGEKVENTSNLCPKCGNELEENSIFCQECGTNLTNDATSKDNICPNCGESTEDSENFCENCGYNLNAPQDIKTESFIEKYKLPLMVGLLIFIIAISIYITPFIATETAGTQIVNVDSFDFKIPDNFEEDAKNKIVKSDEHGTSKHWVNGDEYIEIWILPPKYEGDSADYMVSAVGGAKNNKYGHTGYHNVFTDGGEAFSYVQDNKAIHIMVSDGKLFDKIEPI